MKQTIYCVVKKCWDENNYESAYIISTHFMLLDAVTAAYDEYKALAKLETTTFAEWIQFDGARGLLRNNRGSFSVYVKNVDVEL